MPKTSNDANFTRASEEMGTSLARTCAQEMQRFTRILGELQNQHVYSKMDFFVTCRHQFSGSFSKLLQIGMLVNLDLASRAFRRRFLQFMLDEATRSLFRADSLDIARQDIEDACR